MFSSAPLKELTEKTLEKSKAVKALLDQYGGISGLTSALKDPELQAKLGTWMQDGKKLVLSQEQVQKFLGDARVKAIAEKVSTTPEQVTKVLAEVLPPLLEKMELASQKLPEGSVVAKILGSVKTFLGSVEKSAQTSATGTSPKSSNAEDEMPSMPKAEPKAE